MAAASAAVALFAGAASAATIDADLVFVIDQSGSMSSEYTNLGNGIDSFVN